MLKKYLGVATALALMTPVGVIAAKPAGAAVVLKCAKPSGSVNFKPGITPTPRIQTTSFTLPVKNCTGTAGFTKGTSSGSSKGTKKTSCATFAQAANQKTTVTITWNNGKKSTAKLGTTIVPGAPNTITAVVSGKITGGNAFVGKTIKTKVKVTIDLTCTASHPIKKATLTGIDPLTIS